MDLLNELADLIDKLNTSVRQVRKSGSEYAEADREYKTKLATKILELEAEGRPVTNLLYIARGDKEVADAKVRQISKEAIYKANLEAINSLKLQIKVLDAQIQREYE